MKNIMIIGDSYSTYGGYVPEGYRCYYGVNRTDVPDIDGVENTWWKIFEKEAGLNIVLNDSYSGSTICNTVRQDLPLESSFVNRMDKYIAEDYFSKNEIDTIFIFGGTNDSWIDSPIGEVKYSDITEDDLKKVLPAFCYLVLRAKEMCENVFVIINSDLKEEITDNFIKASKFCGIKYVKLNAIDKKNGHPTALGMRQIAEAVKEMVI